ncbi:MAG: hypothetical protein CMN11_16505 [Roseobacter sp.]|nr:hypothetical protein [Roseobacter sp.]|tara:strand:+ start:845 stop:1273 length:429 start_codon:yes stop_codon:yes gene_type:complete
MSEDTDQKFSGNDFSQSPPPQLNAEEVGIRLTQYVDLRLDTVSARMDGVQSELRAALDSKPGVMSFWGGIATAVISIVGILLGALSIGGDRFEGGMSISPIIEGVRTEQSRRDELQDAKLDAILNQLGQLNDQLKTGPEGQN